MPIPGTPSLRTRLVALWILLRHPRTPRRVRWVGLAVLAYALSPIDLIPDFIPVLGLLDDAVLIPLGLALIVHLTPQALWQECLLQAHAREASLPPWRAGLWIVLAVWLLAIAGFALLVWWALDTAA